MIRYEGGAGARLDEFPRFVAGSRVRCAIFAIAFTCPSISLLVTGPSFFDAPVFASGLFMLALLALERRDLVRDARRSEFSARRAVDEVRRLGRRRRGRLGLRRPRRVRARHRDRAVTPVPEIPETGAATEAGAVDVIGDFLKAYEQYLCGERAYDELPRWIGDRVPPIHGGHP